MSASEALQHEIERLEEVCERLDVLAERHPFVGDALLSIAGSVRNSVTLLQVIGAN